MSTSLPPGCPQGGFGLPQYFQNVDGQCKMLPSFFGGKAPLQEWVGYVIVLGFGAVFAVITSWMIWLEQRYVGTRHNSEWFNTAGRNVKTGLIASVIVSSWTWAATLLQSSNVAWQYGVSGPFWYASGATIQVLLFGIIAIEIKRKAPSAHTMCEIVRARWGTVAHITFLVFSFMTSCIVTAMLILGGSAAVNALTGMSIYISSFLIPMGVVVYTLHGGLKATFLASYLHTAVVQVVLCVFIFLVYTGGGLLGSPSAVYNALQFAASTTRDCSVANPGQQCGPVSGNNGGSFLTMLSSGGFMFGVINIIGNFGTVFVDNGYWMQAISARPNAAHKGYLLGGIVWFCIPFALGTSLGLASLALLLPLTAAEAGAGLVPPASATVMMGTGGSVLILIMLFMAVTSTGSTELTAVSTLITYDIYRTYFNPKATGKQILFVSRVCVFCFGVFMGVLAIILNQAGVSLGWMYLAMGCIIGSAVIPVANVLLWSKANAMGAVVGCIGGMVLGISSWLITTRVMYGELTLATTGKDVPMLVGNLVAILTGGGIHIVASLIAPEPFDFEATRNISMVDSEGMAEVDPEELEEENLVKAKRWIVIWGSAFTIIMVIIWPILSLPARVFSEGYFTFWVVVSLAWGLLASFVIIFLPIWEHKEALMLILSGLLTNDMMMERVDTIDQNVKDMNMKMSALLATMPEAEKQYLAHKEMDAEPLMVEGKAVDDE